MDQPVLLPHELKLFAQVSRLLSQDILLNLYTLVVDVRTICIWVPLHQLDLGHVIELWLLLLRWHMLLEDIHLRVYGSELNRIPGNV